jgi:hypothetical protein
MSPRVKAAILDLDGTACDVRPIRHYVTGDKKDFDSFHKASAFCEPNYDILAEVIEAHKSGLAIVVFTGRAAKWRTLSAQWLWAWEFPIAKLRTRADGDFRKDFVIKSEMWDEESEHYEFVKAWDDNPAIIDLWETKPGLTVRRKPGWDE